MQTEFRTILWRRGLSMMLFVLFSVTVATAQLLVRGTVIDQTGETVIGASIQLKGTTQGTITDIDGKFSLGVPDKKAGIIVSFIGYATKELQVDTTKPMSIVLEEDTKVLDEVVVVGYQEVRKKDLTGSVAKADMNELLNTPVGSFDQNLGGRIAGVNVSSSEGTPGGTMNIVIRGNNSLTQDNSPLYVIDGFPVEDAAIASTINPSDIESLDILKDASATAIYGARGANGVVVITTKNGGKEDSRLSVSFDSYIGFAKIARMLPVLSSEEFVTLDYERNLYLNGEEGVTRFQNVYGSFREIQENYAGRGIDWQEEVLGRTTTSQNYRVNISGGNKNTSYSPGYAYFKNLGAMVYSGDEKHNVSLNLSHKGNKRLSVNARVNFTQSKVYGMGTSEGNARFNKMEHILQSRPVEGSNGTDDE